VQQRGGSVGGLRFRVRIGDSSSVQLLAGRERHFSVTGEAAMPERKGYLKGFHAAEAVDLRHSPGDPGAEPTVAAVEGGVVRRAEAEDLVGVSEDPREGRIGVGGLVQGYMRSVEEGHGGGDAGVGRMGGGDGGCGVRHRTSRV